MYRKVGGEVYDFFKYPMVGLGVQYLDDYPLGYPFDRPINERFFYVPNCWFQDVVIYHKYMKHIDNAMWHKNKRGMETLVNRDMKTMTDMKGMKSMDMTDMMGMGGMSTEMGMGMHGMDMHDMDTHSMEMRGMDVHDMDMQDMYGKKMHKTYMQGADTMHF